MGKYKKSTFHDRYNKAHAFLKMIHSSVYGPFSIASTMRHKKIVIFINDFMRKKYETFSKFIEFKALVEKETRRKVNPLRRNNGANYVPNEF